MLDIVILTVRPMEKDFRFALFQELVKLGHRVEYIFVRRNPEITTSAMPECRSLSFGDFLRHMAGMRRTNRKPIFFNSTNLAFPELSILLRTIAGGRWVFDMHDDLLYDLNGFSRTLLAMRQKLLLASSDLIVHAAPTLQHLFPRSVHLGNGSSLVPLPKFADSAERVLVMASFDGRFDFDFMRAAAKSSPELQFDLHGQQAREPEIAANFESMLRECPNIRYLGPYDDPGLPKLLAGYKVSLAPYKVHHRLTDHIDPLRFYHCLASQTAVVSTGIPQALAMADKVVVVHHPAELGKAIEIALASPIVPARSWADVAQRLVSLVSQPV